MLLGHPALSQIEKRDPELHAAAREAGPAKLRALLMRRQLENALPEAEKVAKVAALEAKLEANPFDVDAQRELEGIIHARNIESNLELAYEHMPEAFTR
jgi:DNA damage-inducible protein 1